MSDLRERTLLASGFHMPERAGVEEFRDALIRIGADGRVVALTRPDEDGYLEQRRAAEEAGRLDRLPAGVLLLPGMIDLHVHAPQYPQLGQALDVPLETWLTRYTFPLESRYADTAFARRSYGLLVEDLLANGTTTALYYATIHQPASRLLADICLERGQRALIGKVAMDHPDLCPETYRDASPDAALRGTEDLIGYIRAHPDNAGRLVHPVITPRFIPACTDETLEALGSLAKGSDLHVQTHCSESDWEHAHVLARHGVTDTESLDRFGLLGRRSVLAHSVFLTTSDMDTIRARRAAVAHCPLSNAYFADAVFPLRTALEKGLHVGLGTDISGGPGTSLFEAMRGTVMVSRMIDSGTDPGLPAGTRGRRSGMRVDFRDAFYLATTGGGIALDLSVGNFTAGQHFDALAIDTEAPAGAIRLWDDLDRGEDLLQKIVYTASKANIAKVWVGGRQVV